MMMMNDVINKAYTDDKPYSFGSKHRLYEAYAKEDVDKALHKNDTYSSFKQHRRSKSYSPIYVYRKRELFNLMLCFLPKRN